MLQTLLPQGTSSSVLGSIARYHWTLDGLVKWSEDPVLMSKLPAPFGLGEVDWSKFAAVETSARDALGLAKGRIVEVAVSKPLDRLSAPAILWRVDVATDEDEKGWILADAKGALIEVVRPGRHTDWLDPATAMNTLARVDREFGAGARYAEIQFGRDGVAIVATDPQAPTQLISVVLADGGFQRRSAGFIGLAGKRPPFAMAELQPLTAVRLANLVASSR